MTRSEAIQRIAAKDPRYAKYLPRDKDLPPLPPTPTPLLPCTHIGKPVRGDNAPDLRRNWHQCDHPQRTELQLAEVTCSCRGCGPNCPGYAA